MAASKERKVKSKNEQDKLTPIPPNAGIEAKYASQMFTLIKSMNNSMMYWLESIYGKELPKLTSDVKAVKRVQGWLEGAKLRYLTKFAEAAPQFAAKFVAASAKNVEMNFERQFKTRKLGIKFEFTPEMRAAAQAEISANVTLINSIPSQYFTEVEGLVMRAVAVGGDLKTLTNELTARYGITKDRAALIARDQTKKVNAVLTRLRQKELGITKATWVHTSSTHPRQSHIDFDGKEYDIEEGALIDGERIWPGQLINCHCMSRSIMPSYLQDKEEL